MEADGDGLESEVQAHHIKKRALKNKALSVSFNEKDLWYDFFIFLYCFDANVKSSHRL